MKKILSLLLLFAVLAYGCTREELKNGQLDSSEGRVFIASFENGETRTYLEDGNLLRWNADDQISLFDGNTLNRQYRFDGETGDNSGTFSVVSKPFGTGNDLNANYAVYPYASDVKISEGGLITATLPAEQLYAVNSFGPDANTMVAVTKDTDDTYLKFKNICGYLKLQLYGNDVTVKSITLTGKNYEKIAGKANIAPSYNDDPTVTLADDATTSITLNCGDGVKIGSTTETATAFWIVVPQVTFEGGFAITITDINGETFTKSTSNKIAVERNVIKPMKAFEVESEDEAETIPDNQIWYTATAKVDPYWDDVFGSNIISNVWDSSSGNGIITFDGNVTSIGKEAFYGCANLTNIIIPNGVTEIGENAFRLCENLAAITIPEGVMEIGSKAFSDCILMTLVVIPASMTLVGEGAFSRCFNLKEFKGKFATEDGRCLVVDGTLNSFAHVGDLEYSIPNSVTTIGSYAFDSCCTLASLTIPESVTRIQEYAFFCCHLSEFKGKFATEDGRCLIVDGKLKAFAEGNITIKYTIPEDVTYIGGGAFSCCGNLADIIFHDNVTTIGDFAFYSCSSLTSITIPDSITKIGDYAFYGCSNLANLSIGDGLIQIGHEAFGICSELIRIDMNTTTPPAMFSDTFNNCGSDLKVYVPSESLEEYKATDYWKDLDIVEALIPNNQIWYTTSDGDVVALYATEESEIVNSFGSNVVSNIYKNGKGIITFDNDVSYIGYYAFANCESLISIVIPNTVSAIGYMAFYGCDLLTTISIPDSVTSIDSKAFSNCSSLTKIAIPNKVTKIEKQTFWGCSSLEDIVIPNSITSIGENSFGNCTSLMHITIPNSVTSFGFAPFTGCSSLTNVTLPNNLARIESGMFMVCSALTTIIIPASVTSIEPSAFVGCYSLEEITIPDNVTYIGRDAFRGCSSLTCITIPNKVTNIGQESFNECTSLLSVNIEATTPPEIFSNTFSNCGSDLKVYVPSEGLEAYKTADCWKDMNVIAMPGKL